MLVCLELGKLGQIPCPVVAGADARMKSSGMTARTDSRLTHISSAVMRQWTIHLHLIVPPKLVVEIKVTSEYLLVSMSTSTPHTSTNMSTSTLGISTSTSTEYYISGNYFLFHQYKQANATKTLSNQTRGVHQ